MIGRQAWESYQQRVVEWQRWMRQMDRAIDPKAEEPIWGWGAGWMHAAGWMEIGGTAEEGNAGGVRAAQNTITDRSAAEVGWGLGEGSSGKMGE